MRRRKKRSNRRYRKNGRQSSRMPLYLAMGVLLFACVWLFRTERPEAVPEQVKQEEQTEQKTIYENAWIVSAKEDTLLFMAEGVLRQARAEGVAELYNTLADVELLSDRVVRIGVKEDTVRGRVLAIGPEFIEIEGYGRLPLSGNFAAYQIYGELAQKDYKSILVGYDAQEFIVGDGQVCGAVIEEEVEATLIRVLLRGDSYEGQSHARLTFSSGEAMLLSYGEEQRRVEPGTELVLEPSSPELSGGRVYLTTESGEGQITVTSLTRAQGNPSYYGSLEVTRQEDRLIAVNEVDLEQYLCFVVPSEMPASYGLEALKAQAVCARSYACRHIMANSLSDLGAHVDDSSGYQVYNNYPSAELSNQAVAETKGQIVTSGGEIAETYYFSTSCGYTTDADIWHSGYTLPYIQGRRVWKEEGNTDFVTAIMDWQYPAYDQDFPWYRWYVDFSLAELGECAEAAGLAESIGTVQELEVSRRGRNGVAQAIALTGEKGSAVVEKEYQIRTFLDPGGKALHRKDGEVLNDFGMLPSGFFVVREILKEGVLSGYRIEGGGFGHGAGMSQNAAKAMAEEGMSYLDILTFFYHGVEIENILTPPAS